MNEYANKLLYSLRATSAARFHAAKRLSARDRNLTRLTAFTSAYVIALTIVPYFIKLPQQVTDNFNLLTVAFSIVILVSSLLQYSSGDVVNAEQHKRCALELDEIQRELRIKLTELTDGELLEMCRRYSVVLQKYSVNHDDVDFIKFQIDRPDDRSRLSRWTKVKIHTRLAGSEHVYSFALVLITASLLWLIFFYAYPSHIPPEKPACPSCSEPK
jgi:SMODS and SLOG-associating 2TM effector domain family 5